MILAFYLHHFSPFIIQLGHNFGLRWYGFAYVMAFLCGFWLFRWLSKNGYSKLPPDQASDFIFKAGLFGVLFGGRLGYIFFYNFDAVIRNPLIIFKIWEGGMSSHGGMLGLVAFTFYYARRHKISWTDLGDNLVVVAPIGLLFGRIANFINGELYGRITNVSWAVQFPHELYNNSTLAYKAIQASQTIDPSYRDIDGIIHAAQHAPKIQELLRGILSPRHPSQLYEAFLEGIVLFSILWILRMRIKQSNGFITGTFFISYAALRIMGEFFREPDAPLTGALTRGQFLSIFLVLIGVVFIIYAKTKKNHPQINTD